MVFYILKQKFRDLRRLCTLHSLLIVNCAILVPNVILCGFNIKTWLSLLDERNSTSSGNRWPPKAFGHWLSSFDEGNSTFSGNRWPPKAFGHWLSSFDEGNSTFSGNRWPPNVFAPINATDRVLLDRTLLAFVAAIEKANLTYFIYGGTLIGSLRHHGPIPWDDDIDVMFSAVDKVKLTDTLSALRPEFGFFIPTEDRLYPQWKFYPTDGHILANREFRSSYVDIFFYQENKTHIWCESPAWSTSDVWLKRHVFPLHRRPFGELSLLAPCNGLVVIGPSINISMCQSLGYSHIKDMTVPSSSIPCQELTRFYPFVRKSITEAGELGNNVTETLMFQNLNIQEVTVDQFCL